MKGYENEYDFVIAINNKKPYELNPILQELIYSIFNNIQNNQIIKAWRNHYNQKSDILIKIGNAIRGVSIKMGNRNSVHVEYINDFIAFLKVHNIPTDIIDKYLRFHYADNTNNNTGNKRITAQQYKINHQKEIDEINKCFANKQIITDAISRFVLRGNNSEYDISAIVLGTPDNFIWLKKEDIVDILLSHIDLYCTSPHFSKLICQPMNRCTNYNKKYEKFRNYVQIKWYSLLDDILEQMNNNQFKKTN